MSTLQTLSSFRYSRIAWQSALAATLCLGAPAGLVLWLTLLRELTHATWLETVITLLRANGLNSIFILLLGSLLWSYRLAEISGYRPWWKIGLATALGILIAWFSPLSNLDASFDESTPIHIVYAVAMCGLVGGVTLIVGLIYGLLLRSGRAALVLAGSTAAVSMIAMLLTVLLFDRFGIRVGTGNFAMSKVTVTGLLASAVLGGMVLGVLFSWFVRRGRDFIAPVA